MKAVIDYLRVAVACVGFVLLDPLIGDLLDWLPDPIKWVTGLISVAVSAGISWVLFRLISPLSFVEFTWGDKLSGVKAAGPILDIDAAANNGQILAVEMKRAASTVLARAILRGLMRHDLRIEITSNQDELQMSLWSHSPLVKSQRDSIAIGFGKPDHGTNRIPFELGLTWDEIATSEFSAELRYTPACRGAVLSWVARVLVRVTPTVKEVRKVGGHV